MKKLFTNPYFLSILVVISFIGIIIYISNAGKHEKWVICQSNNNYYDYLEKLKFRFIDDVFYGYFREEQIIKSTDEKYQKQLDFFKKQVDEVDTYEFLEYSLKEEENQFFVKTFIDVYKNPAFFDQYMTDSNLNSGLSANEIYDMLSSSAYKCEVKRK